MVNLSSKLDKISYSVKQQIVSSRSLSLIKCECLLCLRNKISHKHRILKILYNRTNFNILYQSHFADFLLCLRRYHLHKHTNHKTLCHNPFYLDNPILDRLTPFLNFEHTPSMFTRVRQKST